MKFKENVSLIPAFRPIIVKILDLDALPHWTFSAATSETASHPDVSMLRLSFNFLMSNTDRYLDSEWVF